MSSKSFITRMSYKAVQRAEKRADGTSRIIFCVIINRVKKEFNLNARWPADKFDSVMGIALPKHKSDLSHETVNLIINQANAKAHHIKLYYFAREKELTMSQFIKEFENFSHRDDFIHYWRQKQQQLYACGINAYTTNQRHSCSIDGFIEFIGKPSIGMDELDLGLIQRFNAWLRRKKGLQHNTVCTYLKNLKTYINYAIADGHEIENPFAGFKFKFQPGTRDALSVDELTSLKNLLLKNLTDIERLVLRKFLFSCYTGIRISDSDQIKSDMITADGKLILKTKKGERFGRRVEIPLPAFALSLIEGCRGKIFKSIADQTCNNVLKTLAAKAGIEKRLTFHVSRDTFGTIFIELGGDPVTLKELMGHTDIATTMIYTKMSDKRKEALMSNFDRI
jgi:integrase/recombinase XerD